MGHIASDFDCHDGLPLGDVESYEQVAVQAIHGSDLLPRATIINDVIIAAGRKCKRGVAFAPLNVQRSHLRERAEQQAHRRSGRREHDLARQRRASYPARVRQADLSGPYVNSRSSDPYVHTAGAGVLMYEQPHELDAAYLRIPETLAAVRRAYVYWIL